MESIQKIFHAFFPDLPTPEVQKLGGGLINATYKVCSEDECFILQRLNTNVFHDPEAVMQNSVRLTSFLEERLRDEGVDPTDRVLKFYAKPDGSYLHTVSEGGDADGVWRCTRFIHGATAHITASDPKQLYEAGKGYGEFQRLCDSFPVEDLIEVLPDFHNTQKRYMDFLDALDRDPCDRKKNCDPEIRFLLLQEHLASAIEDKLKSGELPIRVTHNDTKLSNVLLDNETGEAVCVIDLDTVMPGCVLYDFGDAIRTGAASTSEDDPYTDRMCFLPERYEAFKEGFLQSCGLILTQEEIDDLFLGARVIVFEQALRFLTDYLNGDTYYPVVFEAHNLVRARTQVRLLAKMNETLR